VVVDVDIPASGSVTVDFELDPPITQAGSTVQVTVDPGNAVLESSEDNNNATFLLTPASEAPDLIVLEPSYPGGDELRVTIRNDGGELKSSTLVVRVESGGGASELSKTVALAKGQSTDFSFAKPAPGPAKIRVLVNGVQVSAADIDVP
jgi:subtilase family serine protease